MLKCLFAALAAVACAGMFAAAALAHAPAAALPFMIIVGIGGPMMAAYELPLARRALRYAEVAEPKPVTGRRAATLLRQFRGDLEDLPETHHPLGL